MKVCSTLFPKTPLQNDLLSDCYLSRSWSTSNSDKERFWRSVLYQLSSHRHKVRNRRHLYDQLILSGTGGTGISLRRFCDKSANGPAWHDNSSHNLKKSWISNNKMATRGVFLRKTLTCLISRSNNRLRMNYLNCVRCLSLSYGTKASNPGSSKEKNIYDVAIVGGGAMGSSSAYFLASRLTHEMGRICVIERDPTVSEVC